MIRRTPLKSARARTKAQRLIRADALFEVALGVPLLFSGLTGKSAVLGLPPLASSRRVAAFGGGLLPFAVILWRESGDPDFGRLYLLSGINASTGVTFLVWLSHQRSVTRAPGALTIAGTAAVLLRLAAGQARAAHDMSSGMGSP